MASNNIRDEEIKSAGRSLIRRLRRLQVSEVLSSRRCSIKPISLIMFKAVFNSSEGKTGRRSFRKSE